MLVNNLVQIDDCIAYKKMNLFQLLSSKTRVTAASVSCTYITTGVFLSSSGIGVSVTDVPLQDSRTYKVTQKTTNKDYTRH